MRFQGVLVVSALLVLGLLMVEAAVMKGQDTADGPVLVKGQDSVQGQVLAKGHDPVKEHDLDKSPLTEKPGKCPDIPMACRVPKHRQCDNDFSCPGKKKCCDPGCGYMCFEPK
ncbi:elafin-like [Dasypus novemcinctus]|uniref:elafin-like n=1 Tax=Dasypus novemcinctus TaxID=9361 RepID=UPI0003288008|nr:elafin-like [Dasypus novemcinctus]